MTHNTNRPLRSYKSQFILKRLWNLRIASAATVKPSSNKQNTHLYQSSNRRKRKTLFQVINSLYRWSWKQRKGRWVSRTLNHGQIACARVTAISEPQSFWTASDADLWNPFARQNIKTMALAIWKNARPVIEDNIYEMWRLNVSVFLLHTWWHYYDIWKYLLIRPVVCDTDFNRT